MSQTPITVTYSLEEVLGEIKQSIKEVNQKLEKLNNIEVELAEIKTEVKNLKEDVKELKGSTRAQIWTLIGILLTAVGGFVLRFFFSGNP
ncbi:hemolysin XhlA family protein [Crocosphaera sp. UHCC 0190]|uniref:hemolysin XhlA family protein n=1 Tax=Crocosphaera sp. UHCC 0190 TaxID=3110246 RepID=UPI002B21D8B2|nr:hemolysin XhlA family protein [Crocosphaera sp. UHCC 0190]MEA5509427.1 hemolysin XhlA family protein [Crocosphaera sp. UHCC 0190]